MSDLAVSFSIGAAVSSTLSAAVGSTVKHLDRMGKAAAGTDRTLGQVRGYRAMKSQLGATATSLRAAERRTAELRREIAAAGRPTDALRRRFVGAMGETRRLTAQLGAQRKALLGHARALKASAVDVRRLDSEERRLTRTLRGQSRERDRLGAAVARRDAARTRRRDARGDLMEGAALAYAVARPIQAVVGAAVEFEEKMADIRKVVDFPAPGGLKEMGKDILALSTRIVTPGGASGLAEITAEAGQAGIAKGDTAGLLRFAENAAKTATAFDISAKEAGKSLALTGNVFGIGQSQVMDLAGAYNHLSNNMASTAPDLLRIGLAAGGTANTLGMSGQELAALGGTLLAVGTPAAEAATAINAMLMKMKTITTAPKAARQAMDAIGMSAADFERAMREDAEGALVSFFEAAAASDDPMKVLSAIFGAEHADQAAKIATSMDKWAEARRHVSSAQAKASSIDKEYAERAKTTAGQLTLLGSQTKALSINLGNALLPALNDVVGAVMPVIGAVSGFAERFPGATRVVVGLTTALVAGRVAAIAYRYAAASVGDATAAWGVLAKRLRPRVTALTGALRAGAGATWAYAASQHGLGASGAVASTGLGRAARAVRIFGIALMSNPIGLIIGGVALAIGWVISYWDHLKAFFAGFGRGFSSMLDAMGPFGNALRTVFGWIGDFFGWIGGLFSANEETIGSWGDAGEKVGKAVGAVFAVVAARVGAAVGQVGRFLRWVGNLDDEDEAKDAGKPEVGNAVANAPNVGDAVEAARRESPRKARRAGAATAAVVGAAAAVAEPPLPPQPGSPPPPAVSAAPLASSRAATTVTVHVGDIVIHPPPGADAAEIAAIVHRELAAALRRGAVEAGLSEGD